MNTDPRTVEGALTIADSVKPRDNMLSSERVIYTLAAEVRRLQAQAKPDTVALAEAEVVRADMARWEAEEALNDIPVADKVASRAGAQRICDCQDANDNACAALAQARKEGA
jgi:hypothetical protein